MNVAPERVAVPRSDADDIAQLAGLSAGDECAFATLVDRYHGAMMAIARSYGEDAPELVHRAWLDVLRAAGGFDGSASVRAWLVRRVTDIGGPAPEDEDVLDAAVDPARFRPEGGAFPGHWMAYPADWRRRARALAAEDTLDFVRHAVVALPAAQRRVIVLRDIERWSSDETCHALAISDSEQRDLLHRGRSRIRAALEAHLDG